jgi:hypothetical protein
LPAFFLSRPRTRAEVIETALRKFSPDQLIIVFIIGLVILITAAYRIFFLY